MTEQELAEFVSGKMSIAPPLAQGFIDSVRTIVRVTVENNLTKRPDQPAPRPIGLHPGDMPE